LRKIFEHALVPSTALTAEIIEGQRFYTLPDGITKVKSVTTILGQKLNKDSLLEWKSRVGEEEANRVSTQAARRGTAVHEMAEKYILNHDMKPVFRKEMPVNVETFKTIQIALDAHVGKVFGIETQLYSKSLQCAGRTDLVAEYDGVMSIIDFKTSRRIKLEQHIESYFIQTTVYSMMFEWMYKIKVPQIVIIIAVDDEPVPQIFVKERAKYTNRVFEIFAN